MTVWMRGSLSAAGIATLGLLLAACQSTGSNTANLNTIGAPSQVAPVQNSTVQQGTLPALGASGTPAPGLTGQPVLGGVQANTQTAMVNPNRAVGPWRCGAWSKLDDPWHQHEHAVVTAGRLDGVPGAAEPAGSRWHERWPRRRLERGCRFGPVPPQPAHDRQGRHQLLPRLGSRMSTEGADPGQGSRTRDHLGQDPAHRRPHHVGPGNAGRVEHGQGVLGHHLEVVGPGG